MSRWASFTICLVLGLLLIIGGWLVPARLRAIEPVVLARAGHNTSILTDRAQELMHIGQFGAAELLSRAAQHEKLPESDKLAADVGATAKKYPNLKVWGLSGPGLKPYFSTTPTEVADFTDFVVQEDNRNKALGALRKSKQPAVQALLQTRELTNTTTFAPSHEAGGEAFDAAVVVTALLMEQQRFTTSLSNEIFTVTAQANKGGSPAALEQVLIDFLSIGQRFNWGQLVAFVGKIPDADTLHNQADLVRGAGDQLPELFAIVELSGSPKGVAEYLKTFHASGLKDLTASLQYNAGGVRALLESEHRFYTTPARQWASQTQPFATLVSLTANCCWRMPVFALIVKWLLYFGGGFLVALAVHFGRPPATQLEAPLQVRGFHVAREALFALGFVLVMLLVSEPFLAQEGATTAMPLRLRIPTVGHAVQPGSVNVKTTLMDKSKVIPMLLFFVLQGLLYVASIVKLAEIRRQHVGPRIKLRLLENEEHLFDAGLYLGFLGTIVAFIIYSLYIHHQFDLMVAYSSTSFGILFVSFFKIFHLRPVRRRLLLEAEADSPAVTTTAAAPSLASS